MMHSSHCYQVDAQEEHLKMIKEHPSSGAKAGGLDAGTNTAAHISSHR